MNIFITGTDTDIGKTMVTAGIAGVMQSLGYQIGVFKPIQTGCDYRNSEVIIPDLDFVKKIDPNIKTKSSYNFKLAASPDLAAQIEKKSINFEYIKEDYLNFQQDNDIVIIEGAGGILCPIYNKLFMADLISFLKTPLVIVTTPFLGQLNHVLLTIKYAQALGIEIKGIIINKYPFGTKDITIKSFSDYVHRLSGVKTLGYLPEIKTEKDKVNPEILITETLKHIKIQEVFDLHIPKLN